jgi:hypothetical protein
VWLDSAQFDDMGLLPQTFAVDTRRVISAGAKSAMLGHARLASWCNTEELIDTNVAIICECMPEKD